MNKLTPKTTKLQEALELASKLAASNKSLNPSAEAVYAVVRAIEEERRRRGIAAGCSVGEQLGPVEDDCAECEAGLSADLAPTFFAWTKKIKLHDSAALFRNIWEVSDLEIMALYAVPSTATLPHLVRAFAAEISDPEDSAGSAGSDLWDRILEEAERSWIETTP